MEIKRRYKLSYWDHEERCWTFEGWFKTRIDAAEHVVGSRPYRITEEVTSVVETTLTTFQDLQAKIMQCTNMEELREQLDLIDWEQLKGVD